MKLMARKQMFFAVIFVITCFISGCCGLTSFLFRCSNYTFHENSRSTHRLSWLESRKLCNLSGSDLVSIEEFKEWEFLTKAMQRLNNSIKYFIGLRGDDRTREWTWLSNGKSLNASTGEFPWTPGEPSHSRGITNYCVTIYNNYGHHFGRFDDLGCNYPSNDAGYICERAVPCQDHKAPSQDLMSFKVTPLTATSVRTSWQLPQVNLLYRINVRGFKLLYRLRNSSDQLATAIFFSNKYVSKDVSGLEKYTEYEFEVLAFTALGPVISVKVVRTMEDVPSAAPVNLTVASQTSTSILASWLLPPADSRNGIIIGFKLFYKRKGSAESANAELVQGGTTLRKTITGLLKCTEYEVQVLAFTAVGDGPKTLIKTVRTAQKFFVPTMSEDISPPFVICQMGTLCLLFCYATSECSKTMVYSWTKNGKRLAHGDTFKIINNSVVVRPHGMEDYGVYACKASNGIHSTTYNITLEEKPNSSAVIIRRAENESHDSRFVITVTAFSTVIMLLLIPIGLLLWQRRKMSRQNTNVSENGHTHSQTRALMSSSETEQLAYMELQPQEGSLKHVYQTSQGKLENTEYYNVQLNKDNVVKDTGDYEIAATF